jgi:tetratricopeptide (TPR) repeat protein
MAEPPLIETAVAHHRAGRLPEAEGAYAEVLRAEPGNVRALHNLGVLLLRRKDVDRALPLLAAAFATAPDGFPAWVAYVEGLIAAERFAEAEAVLARNGSGPQAGTLQLRLAQAWGMARMRDGDLATAEAQFRRAAALRPDDPETHADLGFVLLRQCRYAEAEESLRQATALAPEHVGALANLGSALRGQGRGTEAETAYRRALSAEPDHPDTLRNLANLLLDEGRFEEALAAADRGLQAHPELAELLLTRGLALIKTGRLAEGLEVCQAASRGETVRYEALGRVALAHATMGRPDEALRTLAQAIALEPENSSAYFRRAFVRLSMRDFEGGWADYEHRMRVDESLFQQPALTPQIRAAVELDARPEDFAGRRVLVTPEQGIGDQVMFASILPDLMRTAAQVTCVCDARLVGLFGNSFPGLQLLPVPGATARLSDYDKVVSIGSLGRIYRNRVEDFPATPYLAPRAAVAEGWAARLGPRPPALRIGLSWRGGAPRTGQGRRSITLDQLRPVLALPGCEFVSLQYGDPRPEVAAVNQTLARPIRVFDPEEIDDFEQLAGLVESLDVVVSVQTAMVHLCGALGKDCLTLVPQVPEWRYTLEGSTMPWYGSVRLFRQAELGVWDPVISRVADVLRDRISA